MAGDLAELRKRIAELEASEAELRKVQETLQEKEQRYRILIETVPGILYELDADGRFTFLSESVEGLGYSPEELIGRHFAEIIHPEDVQAVSRHVVLENYRGKSTGDIGAPKLFDERRCGKRMTRNLETRLVSGHGLGSPAACHRAEVNAAGKWGGDKQFLGTVGIITDITARKETESRLKEAMAVRLNFIATVSHELRTPLTGIKHGIDIVLDGEAGEINHQQKELLDIAKTSVDRLARLVNNVLDFQKLESGRVPFDMVTADVNEAVRRVCHVLLPVAEEKGLELTGKLDDGLPEIRFDMDKIIQVLMNVIGNAIKFTVSGRVTVATALRGNAVRVSVQDTGPGIRAEEMPRLFQTFQRLGDGEQVTLPGTGLGLVISREIIVRHKGKMWAESEVGKGTIFHFLLPVTERRD